MKTSCGVCGNKIGIKKYLVQERMVNKGDTFEYILCPKCGTLQLNAEIDNMGEYYLDNYYSYNATTPRLKIPCFFVKPVINWCMKGQSLPARIRKKLENSIFPMSMSLYGTRARFDNKILDVGCGNGTLGSFFAHNGFDDVTCIDLYCKKTPYNNITFKQCSILDLDEKKKYDLITFYSSFEHMENPIEVLKKVKKLLSGGVLV